jgi:hypothetical protein
MLGPVEHCKYERKSLRIGRAMVQAVSRRPLTVVARVRARVSPVGYVVDSVALGQVFL